MAKSEMRDDAPLRTRRDDKKDDLVFVGRSVLINRPRQHLYDFWRDFQNFPAFMENIEKIEVSGKVARWTVKAPAGQNVILETEITEEKDGRVIGWQSTENSQIKTKGRVTFEEAPAHRGTVVTAEIAYDPPAGTVGRFIAKLFNREPNIQARHELKRFKMLMEAGEIACPYNRKEQAREEA